MMKLSSKGEFSAWRGCICGAAAALALLLWMQVPCLAAGGNGNAVAYPARDGGAEQHAKFPLPVSEYNSPAPSAEKEAKPTLGEEVKRRSQRDPFNLVATIIFCCAVLHTFFAGFFGKWAGRVDRKHKERLAARREASGESLVAGARPEVSFRATLLHFLGEVECIFGIWVIPLLACAVYYHGWDEMVKFMGHDCDFKEPMFVMTVMVIAASRPVVQFAERCMSAVARLGKGTPVAWWWSVLTLAPLLGSFITEPAAMTIGALILARKFFELKPGRMLAYGTLGLLFVNISVGGVLTHFAAPPVVMVAEKWGYHQPITYMLTTFGWKAVLGVLINNGIYFLIFRKQLAGLKAEGEKEQTQHPPVAWVDRHDPVPVWITLLHLVFLAYVVVVSHYPPLFIGGLILFMAFAEMTEHHHNKLNLRGSFMVAFFLAGLVVHGRLQSWWLEPILSGGLPDMALHLGSVTLTAFNDNALITFLASQVPNLDPGAKYAIMSGAIAGGGLTVIANAPNPAGQSLLKRYFPKGVNPLYLAISALIPTVVVIICFMGPKLIFG